MNSFFLANRTSWKEEMASRDAKCIVVGKDETSVELGGEKFMRNQQACHTHLTPRIGFLHSRFQGPAPILRQDCHITAKS